MLPGRLYSQATGVSRRVHETGFRFSGQAADNGKVKGSPVAIGLDHRID
jgi:hypothetical protein